MLLSNLRSSLTSEPKLILGPKVPTFSLAYSKPYLASGGEDGYVYIFDENNHFKIATRRKCEVAEGLKKGGSTEFEVLRVAWGSDGRTLFVGTASGLVEVLLLREGDSGGDGEGEAEPKAVRSLPLGMTSKTCQPCDTPDPDKKGEVNLMLVAKLDNTVDENGQPKEMKDEVRRGNGQSQARRGRGRGRERREREKREGERGGRVSGACLTLSPGPPPPSLRNLFRRSQPRRRRHR